MRGVHGGHRGERDREEYRIFREAGADNYLLKIEAAQPCLFGSVHPDDLYEDRVRHTLWLKEHGYITGSGNIVGLPGQTVEDLAADVIFFRKYGIHMLGIGPFLPAVSTPLEGCPAGDLEMTLKVVAVSRLVCQNVFIPATTAIGSLHPDGQAMALQCGANTIMLIMTPPRYRENYRIYTQKRMVDLEAALKAVRAAGRRAPDYLRLPAALTGGLR